MGDYQYAYVCLNYNTVQGCFEGKNCPRVHTDLPLPAPLCVVQAINSGGGHKDIGGLILDPSLTLPACDSRHSCRLDLRKRTVDK